MPAGLDPTSRVAPGSNLGSEREPKVVLMVESIDGPALDTVPSQSGAGLWWPWAVAALAVALVLLGGLLFSP